MSRVDANEAILPPRLEFTLPYEAARLLRARERIRDYLTHLSLDETCSDEVVLAVMEAATNALRHSSGKTGIDIGLTVAGEDLLAQVRDDGCGFDPSLYDTDSPPDLASDGGRGLFLMDQLMDAVEFRFEAGTEVLMRKRMRRGGRPTRRRFARAASPEWVHEGLNDRLIEVLESTGESFVSLDWEWRYVYVNQEAARQFQPLAEAVIGRSLFEVFPDVRGSVFERCFRGAMEQGVVSHFEGYFQPVQTWVEARVYPAPFGIAVYYRDITARKHLEDQHQELLARVESERGHLQAILENIDAGVVVLDEHGAVAAANPEARRLLGIVGDPVGGQIGAVAGCQFVAGGEPLGEERWPTSRVVRGEKLAGVEFELRHVAEGGDALVRCDGEPIRAADGSVDLAVVVLRDVGLERRTGDDVALHAAVLQAITGVLEAVPRCRDEEELGHACLEVASDLTQSPVGFIGEFGEDARLDSVATYASESASSRSAGDERGVASPERSFVTSDLYNSVVAGGAPVLVNRIAAAPVDEDPAGRAALSSYLGVPLQRAGKTYGVVALGNRPGGYGNDQRWALETLAPVITQVMDGLRSRTALHTSLARTQVLAGIAAAAAGADRPEQVSEAVLVAAALHLGLKAGSVNVLDGENGVFWRSATFGAAFAESWAREPIPHDGATNVSRMVLRGLPYVSHESAEQCEVSVRRFADMRLSDDSWIKLPIMSGENVLGALTFVFPGRRSFRAEDIGFYRSVADQLGVALQRAQLAGEREHQRELVERSASLSLTLDRVNDAVRGVDESAGAIREAAGLAAEALGVRLEAVWLLSDGAWEQLDADRSAEPTDAMVGRQLGELMQAARSPVVVCPLQSSATPEERAFPARESLLATPLVSGASHLGVLIFAAPAERVLSSAEVDFLGKLGVALGGALQNTQLYAALSTQLELSDLLLRASKVLTEWTDLVPMLDRLAGVLLLSAPGSRASVALIDLERQEYRLVASRGIERLSRVVTALDALPVAIRDLLVVPGTLVSDYAEHPQHRIRYADDEFEPRFGLHVPVISRRRAIGLLTLEAPATRSAFAADEVQAVEAIADQVATAIENARLFDAEVEAQRRASRELEISQLLLSTAATFTSETDLAQLSDVVARTLNRSFGNARVSISLVSGDDVHTVVAAAGLQAYPVGARFTVDEYTPVARGALKTGRAAIVDYDALSRDDAGISAQYGMRCGIIAPLVTRGQTIGALTIDHAFARREFTARDLSLAQGIADQAAIAIYNADLFENEREEVRFGEALDEAGRLLHSTLDDDTILAGALESGGRALRAASGVICVLEHGKWVVRYQFGFGMDLVGRAWSDDSVPFMAEARRQRGPVRIGDAHGEDQALAGASTPPGVCSVLTVPLVTGDDVIGLLVYNKAEVGAFSEAEETFATRLARSVSLALQNARLFANEHTIAETLQGALLAMPESIDGFTLAYAYHSATVAARVGGDFYDVFELAEGVVGVVVGDISGKGLDAAVMTSVVKNAIRAQAYEQTKSPADVVRVVNEVLVRSSAPEIFASVFFGVFSNSEGRLRYCNAGHTPGLVIRGKGEVSLLAHTGPVIGAFPNLDFTYAETILEPDELLFLYTDGLIEARSYGALFGESGLLRLFDAPEMRDAETAVQRVVAAVVEYTEGLLSDDLALLAIARRRDACQ